MWYKPVRVNQRCPYLSDNCSGSAPLWLAQEFDSVPCRLRHSLRAASSCMTNNFRGGCPRFAYGVHMYVLSISETESAVKCHQSVVVEGDARCSDSEPLP